jgi:hypothetical protein
MRLFGLNMDDRFGRWIYDISGMEQGCIQGRIRDHELDS